MNIHIKLLPILALSLLTFSCTQDFEDMNTSPNDLTSVPYKTLLTNSEISVIKAYNLVLNNEATWTRYNVRDVYVDVDRYGVTGSGTNFSAYSGHLKNLQQTIKLAEAAGDNNVVAVAQIMKAYAFQNLTDW